MPKNIVIFSDGTGQRGGVLVDENRSNIYKLFRATRCGPESQIDPKEQVAFYDPGLGTLPPGIGAMGAITRWIYNLVSQALGLGLTGNIIECYAAIVRLYRPGDRIFLFGFSRGAYTIRCLGAVISMCGVPQKGKGETPLRLDEASSKKIASEAVKKVYQHTSSWRVDDKTTPREQELLNQRTELGKRFRRTYGSEDQFSNDPTIVNVYPHFIGVFDTVASLANPWAMIVFILVGLLFVAVVGTALWTVAWWLLAPSDPLLWWLGITGGMVLTTLAVGYAVNVAKRFKSEIGLAREKTWRFFHLAEPRMNFYDTQLSKNVGYARHAISIDETRNSFKRVGWGTPKVWRDTGKNEKGEPNPQWFEQIWFAGNHSDVGGSYVENESRLSDISLHWMLEAACTVGMHYDKNQLRLYPDPSGPQHDETKSSRVFKWIGGQPRPVRPDAPLHPSVIARFKAGDVLHYDVMQNYRPTNLNGHQATVGFY